MFIAEAKAPKIPIDSAKAAYQVRRYAWNAKLTLCILTNFNEFAIYDCTKKPSPKDSAGIARIEYFSYKELPEKWDSLLKYFSKQAVYNDSFANYAKSVKGKKGTCTVDEEFLKEIESWRDSLAKNIALRNPSLTVEQLNYSVQIIIDRIIFLQNCEDRLLEKYGTLKSVMNSENIYSQLIELFRKADKKYNSGIFNFEKEGDREGPDILTPSLKIDDKVLKGILHELCEGSYEFSVIPPEILGQVYEQFLGKVIRLTEGHQAKVEFKPEVKKAGGVFYTPQYIVEYIVKHTVGELVKDKTPREVAKLRILDPACGSGSFLLGAYQFLIEWHLEWYTKNLAPLCNTNIPITDPKVQVLLPEPLPRKKKLQNAAEFPIYRTGYFDHVKLLDRTRSDWALSTTEKKRILLNNIYGVDIDHQAVEVTKLSLLLKVLDGESEENIDKQLKLCDERALPSLHQNIKCGNSLVGTDIRTPDMLQEDLTRINPFDWDREFSEIMASGGFDAVIGNPPYVRQELLGEEFKRYAKKSFAGFDGRADLYVFFIEKGIKIINKNGFLGYICSNKYLKTKYGIKIRDFLSAHSQLIQLIDFGELKVFQNASTFPSIIIAQRERKANMKFQFLAIKSLDFQSIDQIVLTNGVEILQSALDGKNWILSSDENTTIIEKMKSIGKTLGEYCNYKISWGIKTGLNDAFIIDSATRNKIIESNPEAKEIIKPFLMGTDIRHYSLIPSKQFLIYTYHGIDIKKYSGIIDYLSPFKEKLRNRATKQEWYELQQPQFAFSKFMEMPKIIYPEIAKEPRFTLDTESYYINNKGFLIPYNDLYLLGLLNSKLIWFNLKKTCSCLGDPDKGGRLELRDTYLRELPIRTINFANPADKARYDKMVDLVTLMLDLNKKMRDAKLEQEKTQFQRLIVATDEDIDKLVYELYGLTPDEIKIVEGK